MQGRLFVVWEFFVSLRSAQSYTTATMRRLIVILLIAASMFTAIVPTSAQGRKQRVRGATGAKWTKDENGEEILNITIQTIPAFHRKRDFKEYQRMVRAVKKVYPLALEAAKRMEDLDEELSKMQRRKDRKEYTSKIEDALKEEISPMLWKMTRYEGKILLKLIDRETKHTAFAIIKDFRSGFTAGFYQMLAKLFGNNLKLEYDPKGEDEVLEQIVLYYKAGLLD